MLARCVICGKTFQAKRSTAKYCSDAHRVLARRRGLAGVKDPDILEAWRNSEEAIEIVRQKIAALEAALEVKLAEIDRDPSLDLDDKRIERERARETYWKKRLLVEPGKSPPPDFKPPVDWKDDWWEDMDS